MHGRKLISIKLIIITQIPGSQDTDNIIQDHGFKGQGHGQHFPKMHFTGDGNGIPIDGSPPKTSFDLWTVMHV